ncbi:GTP-binding protein, partial [Staphylococcus aureus]|uniref:GTP-binding protein n=1 Tax=Staphylococcus aureus TaxID=1280 RepID=UPI00272EDD3F
PKIKTGQVEVQVTNIKLINKSETPPFSINEENVNFDETDERSIADLLIDQVEFCDVFIINKIDLISEEELAKLEKVLSALQPTAKINCKSHRLFFTFSKLLNPFTLSLSMTFKKIINLFFYNAVIRTFV